MNYDPEAGKPDLNTFLSGSTSDGFWLKQSRAILIACLQTSDQHGEDSEVRQALSQMTLTDGYQAEIVYLTLLAWYILMEAFINNEAEWQLIVTKAKAWLEKAGVPKPAQFVKKFTLAVRF